MKTADWVIDMGPEGGSGGGLVVAEGTPEQLADSEESHTGVFLRHLLEVNRRLRPARLPLAVHEKQPQLAASGFAGAVGLWSPTTVLTITALHVVSSAGIGRHSGPRRASPTALFADVKLSAS